MMIERLFHFEFRNEGKQTRLLIVIIFNPVAALYHYCSYDKSFAYRDFFTYTIYYSYMFILNTSIISINNFVRRKSKKLKTKNVFYICLFDPPRSHDICAKQRSKMLPGCLCYTSVTSARCAVDLNVSFTEPDAFK